MADEDSHVALAGPATPAVISESLWQAIRGVKAAVLYAEQVLVVSEGLNFAVALHELTQPEVLEPLGAAVKEGEDVTLALERIYESRPELLESDEWPALLRVQFRDPREQEALRELVQPGVLGVVHAHRLRPLALEALSADPTLLPLVDRAYASKEAMGQVLRALESPAATRRAMEAGLASELLGSVGGFPDATFDVLLDVRARLSPARARFTAAVSNAVAQLSDAADSGESIHEVAAELRRRVVGPATEEIHEELHSLGAQETLLRVASDRATVTAGIAALGLVTGGAAIGAPAVEAVAALLGSASTLAATAKEALFRTEKRRQLASKPYWLLVQAERELGGR